MNFCSNCGDRIKLGTPPGDDRPRYLCQSCGTIHYENPKVVVGCIPEMDGKILLCRRAIEPRADKWTLPAGYLENGETVAQGARRETLEEAGAGSESSDVRLFAEKDIPWDEIAFTVIEETLRQYFKDRPAGVFPFHIGNILLKTGVKPWELDG